MSRRGDNTRDHDPRTPAQVARAERKRAKRQGLITACEPICIECGQLASLVDGEAIYPHRPDLFSKRFYRCECGAYVGCHPHTEIALGKPCGPTARKARNEAHRQFDALWRRKMAKDGVSQGQARGAAYRWLAEQMSLPTAECHIGWMTADQANRVVELCTPFNARRAA